MCVCVCVCVCEHILHYHTLSSCAFSKGYKEWIGLTEKNSSLSSEEETV